MADPAPSPTWVTSVDAKRPIIGKDMGIVQKTFNQLVREQVTRRPERLQYVTNDNIKYTLRDFYDLSTRVAKSIISMGLDPFAGVSIHAFNSIHWFAVDVGASFAACIPSGIYTTNKADIVAYIINDSNSHLIFVDDEDALRKMVSIRDRCNSLRKVVIWGPYDESKFENDADFIVTWDDFLELSSGVSDSDLEERMTYPQPENLCKLIYTSGTTGPPKAVMISHDNIAFVAEYFGRIAQAKEGDRFISYLPLSHVAANAVDVCGAISAGYTVYLADRNALKGTLAKTMVEVRPTVLLAVPRVYEKIQEGLLDANRKAGPVKRFVASWAKNIGRRASFARDDGVNMPWGYGIAKSLVFSNVHKALGLDECRLVVNASAPLSKATDEYFRSLDFRIIDLYGTSEATGPLTFNFPHYKASTSGKALEALDVKIIDEIAPGEGELCFRGRNIFMGYLNNPDETAKTMDDEGYAHSGDIGRVDDDGFVTITGRAKDLLVTSGGENVAPFLVESTLKSTIPAIARAFVVGDERKFISALLIPSMDEEGNLDGPAANVNPNVKTAEAAAKDETWKKYLREGIDKANDNAVSNATKVKNYRLLAKDFTVDSGELTPTMKVKRKVVLENHRDIIESMYQS